KSELVLPFIGIHPENALEPLDKIQNLIENQKDRIAGIGEIGLDPTYLDNNNGNNNDNNDDGLRKQNHTFEALLSLAEKYDKPVSIH
ncbi:MAG: hypothetical protein GWN01_04075, partial [Nitrosopumilaceae archaeon]|nr:hypothetical protein [Nitrosopumilaceae archaeon]NIU86518.1 hypothetical protein [Nitrosopumilaceae archaeon]NIV66837.1 hypothetical protein [Nitrosopumilaceae archaeon]NIX60733.1 hypothetical protein [Nitrosopumilaceae archaeon]